MHELHLLRLRGKLLIYLARGDASIPLEPLGKEVGTHLRKGYVAVADLRATLDEVQAVGVEGFREWSSYSERQRRYQALRKALSAVLAEGAA